jgi:hypothetical protein
MKKYSENSNLYLINPIPVWNNGGVLNIVP